MPPPRRAYQPSGASDPAHDHLRQQTDRDRAVKRGTRHLVFGVVWMVGGLVITLVILSSASPIYVVAWGPVLYGLYRIVTGGLTIRRNRN